MTRLAIPCYNICIHICCRCCTVVHSLRGLPEIHVVIDFSVAITFRAMPEFEVFHSMVGQAALGQSAHGMMVNTEQFYSSSGADGGDAGERFLSVVFAFFFPHGGSLSLLLLGLASIGTDAVKHATQRRRGNQVETRKRRGINVFEHMLRSLSTSSSCEGSSVVTWSDVACLGLLLRAKPFDGQGR